MFHLSLPFASNLVSIDDRVGPFVRPLVCCCCHYPTYLTSCHSLIDFSFFLGLDFHNPALSYIPKGALVIDGLLQALAVRAAGFGVVPLAALVPPVK